MYVVNCKYPTTWDHANLYILSDFHIGDPHADMEDVYAQLQQIQEDPNALFVINGDLINTALKNSVSDVYSELLSPMEQIRTMVDLLRPISKKLIGATSGNHEDRVAKNDGVDITRLICRELKVEDRYDPDGVMIFLTFGLRPAHDRHGRHLQGLTYSIYMTHGRGGGRKEGAKAIRLADMASIVDADIYIHSHSHLPMVMAESMFRVHESSHTVEEVDKLFVNSSSSLNYGGYGQKNEYKPQSKRHPIIHLTGERKLARATL